MDAVDALGATITLITFMGGWLSRSPLMVRYEVRGEEMLRVKRSLDIVNGHLFTEWAKPLNSWSSDSLEENLRGGATPGHPITLLSNPRTFLSLERGRRTR